MILTKKKNPTCSSFKSEPRRGSSGEKYFPPSPPATDSESMRPRLNPLLQAGVHIGADLGAAAAPESSAQGRTRARELPAHARPRSRYCQSSGPGVKPCIGVSLNSERRRSHALDFAGRPEEPSCFQPPELLRESREVEPSADGITSPKPGKRKSVRAGACVCARVCACACRRRGWWIPSGRPVNDSRGYVRSHSGAGVDSPTGDQVNRV